MAESFKVTGASSIRVLRTGGTLSLSFTFNNIPLYQGIDTETGVVSPSWTVAANQPLITPVAVSSRSEVVTLSNHKWAYNGTALVFSGAAVGNFKTDSTGNFQMDTTNGALKIVKNLASTVNVANDTLLYEATATILGEEQTVQKSLDIQIQKLGASSYNGLISFSGGQVLSSSVASVTASTTLYLGSSTVSTYSVKWFKGSTEWTGQTGKTVNVTRADVDGSLLLVAKFYKSGDTANPIAIAAAKIDDNADEYSLVADELVLSDTTTSGTHKFNIVKNGTGGFVTPTTATWKQYVINPISGAVIKQVTTQTMSVSLADLTISGTPRSCAVGAEVTFEL